MRVQPVEGGEVICGSVLVCEGNKLGGANSCLGDGGQKDSYKEDREKLFHWDGI